MKTLAILLRLETASHRKRMMGIFRQIGAAGQYDIRIISGEDGLCDLLASPNASERPDGIISGVPYSERTKKAIVESGIPFVGIGMSESEATARTKRAGFVLNDNRGIGQAAAEFFLRLGGFRSFAYIPDTQGRNWSIQRGQSFAEFLTKARKRCSVYQSDTTDTASLSAYLKDLPKPAAVFAAWDGRAADVIHAAHRANLRIPEDIAILGVDDDELICEHTVPPLSSIKTDAEGMGEAAARMLLGLLNREARAAPGIIRRPILGISERHTTGSPAPAMSLIERALAFINAEATNGISPTEVAKYLKVSRRLLDLRFKQFEEKSVAEMISERKLDAALHLLANSDIPVNRVLKQSGFGNISYATKLFKKTFGETPEAWRSAQAKNTAHASRSDRQGIVFERMNALSDGDEAALKSLCKCLDPKSRFRPQPLKTAVRQDNTSVFVIRQNGRIVATATAVKFSTPMGDHCRIEDVAVSEKTRRQGFGRKIMVEAIKALKAESVAKIELTSRPSRIAANALYRNLGFKLHKTNVYKLSF